MRFHYGAIPEDVRFNPQPGIWIELHQPEPLVLNFLAVPVVILLIIAMSGLLYLVLPRGVSILTSLPWISLPMLIGILPLHEIIHGLFFPGNGLNRSTVLGIWPSRLICYANYEGEITRERSLLAALGPFLILSLLPVAAIWVSKSFGVDLRWLTWLSTFSLISGVIASGDWILFFLVLKRIPKGATIRSQGWRTYWRPVEPAQELSIKAEPRD